MQSGPISILNRSLGGYPKPSQARCGMCRSQKGQCRCWLQSKKNMGQHAFTFIFANEKTGLPFVSIFYSWDAARQRAGLGYVRIHDLRHSFASFLVNAGRSLYEVQEILGHADSRTTTRYAHLSRDRLQEAVESVPLVI